MLRLNFNCTVLLLLTVCTVLAAPVPKHGWGPPVDPDHDCKFLRKGGAIIIEIPGTDHDLAPERKRFNAPRLLRDVEGNFLMQVRVCAAFRPSARSSVDGKNPRVAAGLVLISADKNYIRLEYEAYQRKGEQHNSPAFYLLGEQLLEVHLKPPWKQDCHANENCIYLRLERRGNNFYEAISPDGKTWTRHVKMEEFLILPRKVKVGLAAYSTSTERFKVRFDKLKFVQGQEKDN